MAGRQFGMKRVPNYVLCGSSLTFWKHHRFLLTQSETGRRRWDDSSIIGSYERDTLQSVGQQRTACTCVLTGRIHECIYCTYMHMLYMPVRYGPQLARSCENSKTGEGTIRTPCIYNNNNNNNIVPNIYSLVSFDKKKKLS
jgi:hypothetical protein